ncbi:MAG TPA: TRAM domain-containing protein [Candidatus Nanoarchaeia archaeon]|nr:TRAM domain-containing protein [Candidatus Nanoarchaeia archaeon]
MEHRGFGNRFAPVKEGDEFEATIEALGEKGDGIARKDGFVIFVPGVAQGDKVRIRVTKVLKKVGFGEVAGAATSTPSEGSSNSSDEPVESEEAQEEEQYDSSEDSENF